MPWEPPLSSSFLEFWGKAQALESDAPQSHPLIAHALDVAAVASIVSGPESFLDGRLIGWIVSLHDIGKFSRPFQAKAPGFWPESHLGLLSSQEWPPPGPKHDAVALALLEDVVSDLLDGVFPPSHATHSGWANGDRMRLFRAIAGHHGKPVTKPETGNRVLGPGCEAAARAFVVAMTEVFRPPPLPLPRDSRSLATLEWHLAGLTTLADWVGSRQEWFPYVSQAAVADPAAYFWTLALPRAAAALGAAGLAHARPGAFHGLRRLFPAVAALSPVQRWAEQAILPDGPVLAVIEDLTGSGKTEAAITLAHRLLAAGRAHGIFLALPTMATANAMFDRMADAYRRLFTEGTRPSLALVHGRAALDARFAPGFTDDGTREDPSRVDPADQPAESHCAAWLAEDRRRALLAQIGVGTIDQALLAVLPVRHATLRQQGLRGKVLVIDEAHAFDPYMEQELVALLHFHAAMGGSAILLSATLPQTTRQKLIDAFRRGLGAAPVTLTDTAYPLATLTGAEAMTEHPCAPRDGLPRIVAVTRVPDIAAALARVTQAARAGAAVAWVRNTVDDALAAAALLREQGIEPLVFHARFALCDRLGIETEVLRRFGPQGDAADRAGVLVATQVVEQSLDLDFDLICTDLAPVDRLIQRAGRLWRHERGARVLNEPELLVLSPEPVAAPGPGWIAELLPGTAAVYRDPAMLWRSARAIFARGTLVTPGDMRPMIEAAAADEVPDGLAAQAGRAAGKDSAAAGLGRQNVLRFNDGYCASGAWEPDTHTPTRLEERPQVTLRLALLQDGRIVPYADVRRSGGIRRAWSLSEIVVPQHRLSSCPLPAEWHAAAARAKQDWGRWERESEFFVLAVLRLTTDKDRYMFNGLAETGASVQVSYTPQLGVCW